MMRRLFGLPLAALLATGAAHAAAEPGTASAAGTPAEPTAEPEGPRNVWEVGGVRLERGEVERLASDMATRTVRTVDEKVAGIELRADQREEMRRIYREVSVDVFERVVDVLEIDDLSDAERDARVRELVLEGQRLSHERLVPVLDPAQLALYSAWEAAQVEAYKSPRLRRNRNRRRRR